MGKTGQDDVEIGGEYPDFGNILQGWGPGSADFRIKVVGHVVSNG